MKKNLKYLPFLFAFVFVFAACNKQSDSQKAVEKKAVDEKIKTDEKKQSKSHITTKGPEQIIPKSVKLSASHILLMHDESERKPPGVNRTKAEAKKIIDEIAVKLKKGADFAELAREFSDCPTGKKRGGDLGIFPSRRMAQAFSEATMALKEGEISEPVETPFGYHIILRQKVEFISVSHILLMHDESKRKPQSINRTKKEAKKIIDEIAAKLKNGADFVELAKEFSDCPTKRRGGDLGKLGRGRMAPAFEKAAFALSEGKISDVVETEFGYHIIKRNK